MLCLKSSSVSCNVCCRCLCLTVVTIVMEVRVEAMNGGMCGWDMEGIGNGVVGVMGVWMGLCGCASQSRGRKWENGSLGKCLLIIMFHFFL